MKRTQVSLARSLGAYLYTLGVLGKKDTRLGVWRIGGGWKVADGQAPGEHEGIGGHIRWPQHHPITTTATAATAPASDAAATAATAAAAAALIAALPLVRSSLRICTELLGCRRDSAAACVVGIIVGLIVIGDSLLVVSASHDGRALAAERVGCHHKPAAPMHAMVQPLFRQIRL